jgi:hypothetical protein
MTRKVLDMSNAFINRLALRILIATRAAEGRLGNPAPTALTASALRRNK